MGVSEDDTKSKRSKPKRKQTKRSGKVKDGEHFVTAKVFSNLLKILERCYEQKLPIKAETKKRRAPASKESTRKRRKTNDGAVEDVSTDETNAEDEEMLSR